MTKHRRITFEIPTKKVINSNRVYKHFMAKATLVSYLRELSGSLGVEKHDHPELAAKRREAIHDEQRYISAKSRAKRLSDDGSLKEDIAVIDRDLKPDESSSEIKVPYLFERFTVRLTVCPPTRRRFDPPNLYPTLKPLIDGLTDASWWEDDDFSHLLDVSFRYGGLSGKLGTFVLILDVYEVDEDDFRNGNYVIESEYTPICEEGTKEETEMIDNGR